MNYKKILTIIIIMVVVGAFLLIIRGSEDTWLCQDGQWVKHGMPSGPMPLSGCGDDEINSFDKCVAAGFPVMESYPLQCRTDDDQTFVQDIGNELEKIDLIRVDFPRPNQTVQSPLIITGQARGNWFFEGDFPIKLLDDNEVVIVQSYVTAKSEWMTEDFIQFEAKIDFDIPTTEKGVLVLEKDNPSGLPEYADELRIPIVFSELEGNMIVKAYFVNDLLEGDSNITCQNVYPAEREVPKTIAVARAALEELLKGLTEEEKMAGFSTAINENVKIQKLYIDDNIAYVDFDEQLEHELGGSCRVALIGHQITETLKQFPTVDSVKISVNGRTEDILQP
ncbi:GerMN domain-containing protein [Patescibacteria group bacterium]|nr:GerMN domain-containing protein [Patescibacteria group bacterium]